MATENIILEGGPAHGLIATIKPDTFSYVCPCDDKTPPQLQGARFGRTKSRDRHFGLAIFRFRGADDTTGENT